MTKHWELIKVWHENGYRYQTCEYCIDAISMPDDVYCVECDMHLDEHWAEQERLYFELENKKDGVGEACVPHECQILI